MLTPGVIPGQATDNFGAPQQQTMVNGSPNSSIGPSLQPERRTNSIGLRNTGNSCRIRRRAGVPRLTNSYAAEYGRFRACGGPWLRIRHHSGPRVALRVRAQHRLNATPGFPARTILPRTRCTGTVRRQRRRPDHQRPKRSSSELLGTQEADHGVCQPASRSQRRKRRHLSATRYAPPTRTQLPASQNRHGEPFRSGGQEDYGS